MVGQVSGYNSAYATDAIKYLQGQSVVEPKTNLLDTASSSVMFGAPMGLFFSKGIKKDYAAAADMASLLQGKTIAEAPKKTGFFKSIGNFLNPSGWFKNARTSIGHTKDGVVAFAQGVKNAPATIKAGKSTSVAEAWKMYDTQTALNRVNGALSDIPKDSIGKVDDVLKTAYGQNLVKKQGKEVATKIIEQNNKLADALVKQSSQLDNAIKSGTKVADDVVFAAHDAANAVKQVNPGFFKKATNSVKALFNPNVKSGSELAQKAVQKAVGEGTEQAAKKGLSATLAKTANIGLVGDLVIEGGLEIFTEIVPAFQNGGLDSGFKQLGKSAVTVGASVAGWAVGAKAGAALGTAIGTAIFPGVGSAAGAVVGGIVGFIGGMFGSSMASEAADAIVGPSENEIMAQEATEEQGAMIATDQASMQEVNMLVAQQVQAEIDAGVADEDTEKMMEYLQAQGSMTYPTTMASTTNFGGLTTNSAASTGSLIAKNPDGSYDYSMPVGTTLDYANNATSIYAQQPIQYYG